jgi:hypothetical protein
VKTFSSKPCVPCRLSAVCVSGFMCYINCGEAGACIPMNVAHHARSWCNVFIPKMFIPKNCPRVLANVARRNELYGT